MSHLLNLCDSPTVRDTTLCLRPRPSSCHHVQRTIPVATRLLRVASLATSSAFQFMILRTIAMPSRRDLCSTLLILVMTASFGVIPAFADYRTPRAHPQSAQSTTDTNTEPGPHRPPSSLDHSADLSFHYPCCPTLFETGRRAPGTS